MKIAIHRSSLHPSAAQHCGAQNEVSFLTGSTLQDFRNPNKNTNNPTLQLTPMNDLMKTTKPLMGLLAIALCGLLPATTARSGDVSG